jgi:hypothetical protein
MQVHFTGVALPVPGFPACYWLRDWPLIGALNCVPGVSPWKVASFPHSSDTTGFQQPMATLEAVSLNEESVSAAPVHSMAGDG